MMNQPLIWYVPGYYELSFFEIVLIAVLFISILIKKEKLVMIIIGAKLIIHHLVIGDIFWAMARPVTMLGVKEFLPLLLKQIIYIVILIWMMHFELKKDYKKVFFGILVLFGLELLSSFIYYPLFMESVTRNCPDCFQHLSKRQILWHIAHIAAAPFIEIKNRLLVTSAEVILFFIQILLHRKDEKS